MGISNFKRLLRIWAQKRDVSDIAAVGGPRRPPGQTPHPGDEFLRMHFERIVGLTINEQIAALQTAARERGVPIRKIGSLRQFISQLRRERDPHDDLPSGLFIDHVALQIPVDDGESRPVQPIASVLGFADTIIHTSLSLAPVDYRNGGQLLLEAYRQDLITHSNGTAESIMTLRMDTGFGAGWDRFIQDAKDAGLLIEGKRVRSLRGGGTGLRMVRPRLLGFDSRPNLIGKEACDRSARFYEKSDRLVTLMEAARVLEARRNHRFGPQKVSVACDLDLFASRLS
jgi:hypothetical protein